MIDCFIFGKTENQLAIPAFRFGSSGPSVLIIGGVHGDEYEGVTACHGLLYKFTQNYNYNLRITLVPCLNLDGHQLKQRKNSNGVDLNRNLPSKDWTNHSTEDKYFPGEKPNSESENQALVDFIKHNQLQMIYSLHSWKPLLNTNGDCIEEAKTISQVTGYEITADIGYPTPGSLGTYCGIEGTTPTLTYEIERGLDIKNIIHIHVPALIEGLKTTEKIRSVK